MDSGRCAHLICQETFGSLTLDGSGVFLPVLYYEIDDVEKCYMAHVPWRCGELKTLYLT